MNEPDSCTIGTVDGMKHIMVGLPYAEAIRAYYGTPPGELITYAGIAIVPGQIAWIREND